MPGPQVVNAQIDGAQLAEAMQTLRRRFVQVPGTDRRHDGKPAHGIDTGTDDATVQPVGAADQFRSHDNGTGNPLRLDRGDLQSEHPVEGDHFLENMPQTGNKFGLELAYRFGGMLLHEVKA
jgi:hypothetical protein